MQHLMKMETHWNPNLVVLSVGIAIIGSYIALDFIGRMRSAQGRAHILWFISGTLIMGLAIWSMHFLGMLALDMQMPVTYNLTFSAFSMIAAVIGSGTAFAIMSRPSISKFQLFLGSILMGMAIVTMHYLGMASMEMAAQVTYNPFLFTLSVMIALLASGGALWVAFKMRTDQPNIWFLQKIGSALVMGGAIAGMHYTGMAAASYEYMAQRIPNLEVAPRVGIFKLSDLLIFAGATFSAALLFLSAQTAKAHQIALKNTQKSIEREQLATELIDSIRSETELGVILCKTVDSVGRFTLADRCTIWLYHNDRQQFELQHEYRKDENIISAHDTALPFKPILLSAMRHTEVLNFPDILQAGNLSDEDYWLIEQRKIKSLLHVPILYKDDLLGALRVHAVSEKREWDLETIALVKHMSAQVAIAISHAKLIQELKDAEARKSGVLESSLDAIITMDHTGKVREWNASAERIFGYPFQDAIGRDLADLIIPESYRKDHYKGMAHHLATGEGPILNQLLEMPALRADGTIFPSELSIVQIPGRGAPMFTGTMRDITLQKNAQQELERQVVDRTTQLAATNAELRISEERFRLLVNGVKDYAIFRMDPQGFIQTWNKGAERITRYQAQEIIGQHFSKFYTPEDLERDYPAYELKVAIEQGRFETEGWRVREDGSCFWAKVAITPIQNEKEELLGFSKVTQDLTSQKAAEGELLASEQRYRELAETLQQQSKQLLAVNKELEAFSYSVSHDLRSPLRTIDGFSQAVLELYGEQLDDKGKDYLGRVRQGSQQMAQLIDDMLQLSRLTRGEMKLGEQVNMSQLLEEMAQNFHHDEPERLVQFEIQENVIAQGDKRLLQAVLQNLISNAWKYTSKHARGNIKFGCLHTSETPIYYFQDDGAGFDMRYADKLFGAFQRLHGVGEFPGTGVGLATVARIVHRHGGEIWAKAEVEKGATFFFTLQSISKEEKNDALAFQPSHSFS
jgi:PAS domain S-box-containing protein